MTPTTTPTLTEAEACARAQELAREAADRFFKALMSELPRVDVRPDDVDMLDVASQIAKVMMQCRTIEDWEDLEMWRAESNAHAGYLLGVEVGRRIGGAR